MYLTFSLTLLFNSVTADMMQITIEQTNLELSCAPCMILFPDDVEKDYTNGIIFEMKRTEFICRFPRFMEAMPAVFMHFYTYK